MRSLKDAFAVTRWLECSLNVQVLLLGQVIFFELIYDFRCLLLA